MGRAELVELVERAPELTDTLVERLERRAELLRIAAHPAHLAEHVKCIDRKSGEIFRFQMLNPTDGWYWQREYLDWCLENPATIVLKGRQLGVTWVSCLEILHLILFRPGAAALGYSINELEAATLIDRVWDMFESLPEWIRGHVVVETPQRGRPSTLIELKHPDGRISAFQAMVSTKKAGHGRTAALVLLDEFSRADYAAEIWKAVLPTMADGGQIRVVSTANGVSVAQDGRIGGNFYHHLWVSAEGMYARLKKRFLRWDLHPNRDAGWKADLIMPADDKAEQYPDNPDEAFLMSGRPFFDRVALKWYRESAMRKPAYRFTWTLEGLNAARKTRDPSGLISVFEEPARGRDYAIGADTATGHGLDFSSAHVVDLATGAIVAKIRAKIDPDLYAFQLHFLGRWYNTAKLAVEKAGGYGDSVIIFLRDGKDGRPAYPNLYRHREETRTDLPERKQYGFPMNVQTRPQVLSYLAEWIRDRKLPWLDDETMGELQTFVHTDTNPSPRAQDGTNDDQVFSLAIALELYRRYGHHPHSHRNLHKKRRRRPQYRPLGH